MKLTALVAAALVAAAASALAGCSPAIGQWVERGQTALDVERENLAAWHALAVAGVAAERNRQIAAAAADTKLVLAGGVAGPDGAPLKLSAEWLDEQSRILSATLSALDGRRAGYDEQYRTCLSNVASIRESFVAVQRLNRAYAGSSETLQAQIARLTELVLSLASKEGK